MIVDAVGVTETDLVDTEPLDRKPTVPLEKLMSRSPSAPRPRRDVSRVAGRLARLDRRLDAGASELELAARRRHAAREIARGWSRRSTPTGSSPPRARRGPDEPDVDAIAAAPATLLEEAVAPLAPSPELRERLVEVRRLHEQAIDETSRGRAARGRLLAGGGDRARSPTVESWERFFEENRDEITALQILYARP